MKKKPLNSYGSLSWTWVWRLRRTKPLQVTLASKLMASCLLIYKRLPKQFNSFYTTAASKLVAKATAEFKQVWKELYGKLLSQQMFPNSYSISIVSENKKIKYLNSLGINTATGLDGITSRFVRDGASIIACPLTHVIYLSLIQCVVPDDLKSARVVHVPLSKKSDKTELGNNRPVSILTIISKVIERVCYDQVESYLGQKKVLYTFQSGVRSRYSTYTCLTHLTDFIKNQMGHFVAMVLLDLLKVDHGILLMKLKALGLSQDVSRWFPSYLSDHQQLVEVSGTLSSHANISCCVPQNQYWDPFCF